MQEAFVTLLLETFRRQPNRRGYATICHSFQDWSMAVAILDRLPRAEGPNRGYLTLVELTIERTWDKRQYHTRIGIYLISYPLGRYFCHSVRMVG